MICPMVEESEMIDAENVLDYTKILRQNLPGIPGGVPSREDEGEREK